MGFLWILPGNKMQRPGKYMQLAETALGYNLINWQSVVVEVAVNVENVASQ